MKYQAKLHHCHEMTMQHGEERLMRDKSLGEAHDSYQSMHEVSSQITPLP